MKKINASNVQSQGFSKDGVTWDCLWLTYSHQYHY